MLTFDREGQGEPTFIFVHGFGCAREDWSSQVAKFSCKHECVSLDLPGFGETPALETRPSMEKFGAAVLELMDAEGIGRAVLFGHSMGCRPAMELSVASPERVLGLVLVDPGRATTEFEVSKRQFDELIAERGFPDQARAMFREMFFDPVYAELRDRLAERAAMVPPEVAVQTYLALLDWDAHRCEAVFDAISVPVLVLQSTTRNGFQRRPLRPGELAPYQQMAMERIAGAETESYPGVGHFTMIEASLAVNDRVQRFVERIICA
jgi:pimeloyl-ACP methyl ester carboxylesterase